MTWRVTLPFASLNLWVAVLVHIFLRSEPFLAVGGFDVS